MSHRLPLPTPLLLSLLLAAACGAQNRPAPAEPARAGERPRLVVICSVDQLATWVLEQGLPHLSEDGGFRRLLREGTSFDQCAFVHGCTETGPGHATLSTGAPAASHGIVKNVWWDPATQQEIYCAGDPEVAALPELPEARGRGPGRLLAPTLGDAVKAHLGSAARVVSVAWKDRSAILMAGRSADVAAWIETTTGRLVTNTAWCETLPAWIAAFNERKVLDGFFGWTWERSGPATAYVGLDDDRRFELPHQNGSNQHTLPQPITGGKDGPELAFYTQAYYSPVGNEVVLQAALAALAGAELGRDAVPDVLWVGFSSTDLVGHVFGPDSVEARDTLLRLDRQLAQLLAALDQQVGAGRYLFLLSSDHGIGPIPEVARQAGVDAGRGLVLTRAKAAAETALVRRFGSREGKGPYVARASELSLFLDRAAVAEQAQGVADAVLVASRIAAEAAAGTPGALTAYATADLLRDGPGHDPIRRAMYFAAHPDRAGDVLLVLRPYWLDGTSPASHGSPHAYDRQVPLLAMGAGMRAGHRCFAPVSPGLAVVLAAHALGIPPPSLAVDTVPDGVFHD